MNFINSVLRWVAIILVVIAFIYLAAALLVWSGVFTAATMTAWLGFGVMTFTSAWALLVVGGLVLTLAYLVDPVAAQEAVDRITGAAADAAEDLGDAITNILGGAARGLLSSPLGMILVVGSVYLGYKVLINKSDNPQPTTQRSGIYD